MRSDLCDSSCAIGSIHSGDAELGTMVGEAGPWRVSVLHRLAHPGWLIVAPCRHVEAFGELSTGEGHDFADLVAGLDRAIRTDLAPAKVYLLALGDTMPHWHLLVAPVSQRVYVRGLRGASVLSEYPDATDTAAATRTARRLVEGQLVARPVR